MFVYLSVVVRPNEILDWVARAQLVNNSFSHDNPNPPTFHPTHVVLVLLSHVWRCIFARTPSYATRNLMYAVSVSRLNICV